MKNAIVLGLRDQRSIALGIGEALSYSGARVIYGYQPRHSVSALSALPRGTVSFPLEVTDEKSMDDFVKRVSESAGNIDYFVHSIAFAKKEHLRGSFFTVDLEGWNLAMRVSAYSFLDLVRKISPHLNKGAGILTLTYKGSAVPARGYHLMGACKAALEACVRYLAYELPEFRINALSCPAITTSSSIAVEDIENQIDPSITIQDIGNSAVKILTYQYTGKIVRFEEL